MCKTPFSNKYYTVSLAPEDVDGFIFWTKNIGPLIKHLPEIKKPFVVQFSINNYPKILEGKVIDAKQSISNAYKVSNKYGDNAVVWRYDTIVFSNITDFNFHVQNFEYLAKQLRGITNEVTISFLQLYKKSVQNLNSLKDNFSWYEPSKQEITTLLQKLIPIAQDNNMQLSLCAQPEYMLPGTQKAHCTDPKRLSRVAGYEISARPKPNRSGCGCAESIDIGEYNTCLHNCAYCYATTDHNSALENNKKHNPNNLALIGN